MTAAYVRTRLGWGSAVRITSRLRARHRPIIALHRGATGAPTRPRATRQSRVCVSDRGRPELSHRRIHEIRAEGVEGADPQGGPAPLRALEGPEAGGGHRLERARAAGRPGRTFEEAPRWRAAAWRGLRDPRRRQRPDLPPPERGGPDARGARRRAHPLGRQRGCCSSGGEKMAKSVGQIPVSPHDAVEGCYVLICSSSWWRRWTTIQHGGDAMRPDGRAAARGRPPSSPGASPEETRAAERFFAALAA